MTRVCYQKWNNRFWAYYDTLTQLLKDKQPNAAHYFSQELEGKNLLAGVITQNVDGLYRGLLPRHKLVEIHGHHLTITCSQCHQPVTNYSQTKKRRSLCCRALVEPGVVLIGDTYTKQTQDDISNLIKKATHLIVMGTQLTYPFIHSIVADFTGKKILINNTLIPLTRISMGIYGDIQLPVEWDEVILTDLSTFNSKEVLTKRHINID